MEVCTVYECAMSEGVSVTTAESPPVDLQSPTVNVLNSTAVNVSWASPRHSNGIIVEYQLHRVAIFPSCTYDLYLLFSPTSAHPVSSIKPAFHDTDVDTDTDILARMLADTSDTRDFLKLFLWQAERHADIPVSYTHLTLPTIYSV